LSRWTNIPNPENDPLITQLNLRGRRLGRGSGTTQVSQTVNFSSGGSGLTRDPWYMITFSANITVDRANGTVQRVTLGGDAVLEDPVGFSNGDELILRLQQDATGGRTVTLNDPALWELPAGFTLFALANRVIILHYRFDAAGALLVAAPTIV
jgi:hypothetical protein